MLISAQLDSGSLTYRDFLHEDRLYDMRHISGVCMQLQQQLLTVIALQPYVRNADSIFSCARSLTKKALYQTLAIHISVLLTHTSVCSCHLTSALNMYYESSHDTAAPAYHG